MPWQPPLEWKSANLNPISTPNRRQEVPNQRKDDGANSPQGLPHLVKVVNDGSRIARHAASHAHVPPHYERVGSELPSYLKCAFRNSVSRYAANAALWNASFRAATEYSSLS